MKTMKQIMVAAFILTVLVTAFGKSKGKMKEFKTACQQSTHQAYRSMVSDYIF